MNEGTDVAIGGGAVHILDRKTANINVKKTYQFKNQYKDDVIISDN